MLAVSSVLSIQCIATQQIPLSAAKAVKEQKTDEGVYETKQNSFRGIPKEETRRAKVRLYRERR